MTLGATCLYVFCNYFLKEFVRNKFLNRFKNLEEKFKKSEFIYLVVYRFVGGIPFQIQNVLPCMFNVKIYNYLKNENIYLSTFLHAYTCMNECVFLDHFTRIS